MLCSKSSHILAFGNFSNPQSCPPSGSLGTWAPSSRGISFHYTGLLNQTTDPQRPRVHHLATQSLNIRTTSYYLLVSNAHRNLKLHENEIWSENLQIHTFYEVSILIFKNKVIAEVLIIVKINGTEGQSQVKFVLKAEVWQIILVQLKVL